ncbi:uncharacterized protein EV420DRAFT_1125960 [Desarmillaria tabescens]|uniref:Secreted protein n=1 Tax=Armillaria tabescens TaxID=1929756 RepID=A0AA39JFA4_ARMTA|nr:uncharacterized protein EV420DRAFT_1125960 [Desarmillaria tabescens]KAK0440910.1 hypothetical protein EV420DRAFT_1125960 [Desarmillaria tabescens]
MAMKSAMGLLRTLALPPIVLGLLVDGFRITVVCCSRSEAEDLVTELPEKLDRAAHVQVEKSISSGTFPWWKTSSDRHLGSNQTNDTIRDWCDDAASKVPPSSL